MFWLSQVSPIATVPSCMSFCSLGTTMETVGIVLNPTSVVGKAEKGWLSAGRRWLLAGASLACQFTAGLCLRIYWFWPGTVVALSPVNPTEGRLSEKVVKVRPLAISSAARFGVEKGTFVGVVSPTTA